MRQAFYLHGFVSGARSTKAAFLARELAAAGVDLHTPDLNAPEFRTLTLSRMIGQVRAAIAGAGEGPVALIGSSLGGLVAWLAAAREPRVDCLVLLAPAFDITGSLVRSLGPAAIEQWRTTGALDVMHFAYGEPRRLAYGFVEDAARYDPFHTAVGVPTLIFQGRRDEAVNPAMVERFAAARPNVTLRMLDDDHQLLASLPLMAREIERFLGVGS